ncbi:MAG: helix-turn-helix domain-containing protein [Lachnospiraceae bacterium]|nr:helix-turn-helix domain-containing protein [Lachnospiraceae bacterium]
MKKRKFIVEEAMTGDDIKILRKRLRMTQQELADFVNVSKKTIERWEAGEKEITGPIVTLSRILQNYPELPERMQVPELEYPMRLWYLYRQSVCSIIDVDERKRQVKVYNYVDDSIFRAFGVEETPSYEQYEEFLEERCFPRNRDKMKLILKDLDLPFYDPLMIIEKTQGRMAEDDFWIRIERK